MPSLVLHTARLTLRPLAAEDWEPWAGFMATEHSRFIGGPQVRAVAWRSFLAMVGAWQVQGFAMFSVIERDTGRWLGRVGPWVPEGWPGTEVGWALIAEATGRGYATEAAAATIDWAFDVLGWDEVIHTIAPDNAPSIAVARRLGAANRGPGRMPAPFEHLPVDIWGQTRAEWRARR